MTNLFLNALSGLPGPRPPFWFMRQAGRYLPEYREIRAEASGFLDLCYTPERAANVTLQPIRRFHADAAILFSDILVIPDALGQKVSFIEGEGPVLNPVRNGADVAMLDPSRTLGHLAPVFETVQRVRTELPDEVALIGFCGAPWTVASYMIEGGSSRDFSIIKSWAVRERRCFETLMGILVESTAAYLLGQVEAGAQALQIFDTWAGNVPARDFDEWVISPTARIVASVKMQAPDIPIIGFARGVGDRLESYIRGTGVDAVGLDSSMTAAEAAQKIQPICPVQGNLDPAYLMVGGDEMERAANEILDELSGGPFVFNLAHGVHKDTPVENVERLAEIVRSRQAS
ncbi:MAG: uroporphyrinogen decarboxylase [Alphaproteobacteria bacterium]|nr:uroporphyrinogen decarboxylase [Alphaproteobacteria bacterium]